MSTLLTDAEAAALRPANNPAGEPTGHFTGRCARCGSADLWDDNMAYGCECCGAFWTGIEPRLVPNGGGQMRDMTPAELDSWYRLRQWPCCGGGEYIEGPHGGMSVNLTCPSCGMQINVVDPKSHWSQAGFPFGQVLREGSK